MKKFLPLLFLFALFLLPNSAQAGLSDACFPSVECDPGEDYYGGSCQAHIETVANCPAAKPGSFPAFSCDYGCFSQSTPPSVECPGGVVVNGNCLTTLYLVDDANINKIWDGVSLENISGDSIWSLNGTNAYYNGGNVGIGTMTPLSPLQVVGNTNAIIASVSSGTNAAIVATAPSVAGAFNGNVEIKGNKPLRVVADNIENVNSRIGTMEADNSGNFIHAGSESNHDFYLVSNDIQRVTVGSTGLVGINTTTPNYTLDVAGALNLNKGLNGAALYVNAKQVLWYAGDWLTWGLDGNSNYFPKRVSIGNLGNSASQLYVAKSDDSNASNYAAYHSNINVSGTGSTYGSYNSASNQGGGISYGSYNSGSASDASGFGAYNYGTSQGESDTYGSYNYAYNSKLGNVGTAFGLFASAYNVSSSCGGPDCGEAYGLYATTGNTDLGTGVYGEGRYYGVHAVAKAGGDGIALYSDSKQPDGIGAMFRCTGNCTSAIFVDGNDSSPNLFESGVVIIGSTGGTHLSLDGNEIMAKTSGNIGGTLYINKDSTGDVEINMAHNSFASSVCRSGEILGYCASLREKKKNIENLDLGLETVMKMRPVSFDWKEARVRDDMRDVGFIAEEANEINPILGEYNEGKLTGFKYTQYTAVLTKAIQEQQAMIHELKTVVCLDHPEMKLCNQ